MRRLSSAALVLVLTMGACVNEDLPQEPEVPGVYSVTTVSATDKDGTETKSILTVDPCEIETLQVFAFDPASEKILIYGEGAGAALKGKPVTAYVEGVSSFEWCLPVGIELDIYAVANIGKITTPSTVDELLAMDDMRLTFDSLEDLNDHKAVPMHGILKGAVDTGDGNELVIKMKKVLARYDISIAFEEFPEGTQVHRLTVRNAHKHATLFGSNEAAKSADDLTREMDYTTEDDLALLNAGETITLYLPENMQTAVNGATSTANNWKEISDDNMTNMDFCSYMEIVYTTPDMTGTVSQNVMRVYFGKHPTTNFDIERNRKTNVRVKLTGTEVIVNGFFEFTEPYLTVKPGESVKINFTYGTEILEGRITQSCFEVMDQGLSLSDIKAENGQGQLTATAWDSVDSDREITVFFSSPMPEVADVSAIVFVDYDEIPERVYWASNSGLELQGTLSRGTDSEYTSRIFAEFEDGSVLDISDVATVTTSDSRIATYSSPDVYFGSTTGEAVLTADYLGVVGTCSVYTEPRRISLIPSKNEVTLKYGESIVIDLRVTTNFGGLFNPWPAIKPGFSSTENPSIKSTVSSTLSEIGFDSYIDMKSANLFLDRIPTLTITAGNAACSGTIKLDRRPSSPKKNSFTGQEYYDYGPLSGAGSCTIKVNVIPSDNEYGSLQSLRVEGPSKVMVGEDVTYNAIGTFLSSDGEVKEYTICSLGDWTSDVFDINHGKGVFNDATTSGASRYSKNGSVSFSYHGMNATLPVFVYAGTEYTIEYINKGTYRAQAFFNPYEHTRFYMDVWEPYVKMTIYDCDDNVIHSSTKIFECSFLSNDGRTTYHTDGFWIGQLLDKDMHFYKYGSSRKLSFTFSSSGAYDKEGNPYDDKTNISVGIKFQRYFAYSSWDEWSDQFPSQRAVWKDID